MADRNSAQKHVWRVGIVLAKVRDIEARGVIPFYFPAYSPEQNPIEQLFAKLKAIFRKVAAYTLKNATFIVGTSVRASPLASTKSAELNAPHTSRIQDMVNVTESNFGA